MLAVWKELKCRGSSSKVGISEWSFVVVLMRTPGVALLFMLVAFGSSTCVNAFPIDPGGPSADRLPDSGREDMLNASIADCFSFASPYFGTSKLSRVLI